MVVDLQKTKDVNEERLNSIATTVQAQGGTMTGMQSVLDKMWLIREGLSKGKTNTESCKEFTPDSDMSLITNDDLEPIVLYSSIMANCKELLAMVVELQKSRDVNDEWLSSIAATQQAQGETMKGIQSLMDKLWNYNEVLSSGMTEHEKTQDSNKSIVTEDEAPTSGIFSSRNLKIEIPRFNGEDAEGWVYSIEEFFEIYATPSDQRLKLASVHLDGPARDWYIWVEPNKTVSTYFEFISGILVRFGKTLYEDPKTALKKLQQENSGEDYQAQFKKLSTKVTGLTEDWLVSIFVGELKGYIQTEVILDQTVPTWKLSLTFARKLSNYALPSPPPVLSQVSPPATSGTKGIPAESSSSYLMHKCLTAAEIKAKRA
ncbi:Retrovirus-related Pol polyprotein [Senna tora]|uniref:Retrovirus-related Pol polyprotein n=1 Tax=Senna tora TaxID=362788 RepID=A0A834WSF7_9FABA|nr:Retrovirus-related Pol polyprotein [Senna tora]